MVKYLVLFIFFMFSQSFGTVFDHPLKDIDSLNKTMYDPDVISGKFIQTRYISSLDVTLKSEGEFAIDKKSGLMWRNTKPVSNVTVIQNGTICIFANGKQSNISSSDNAAIKEILNVINSIFTRDYNGISKYFQLYFQSGKEFTLGLKTKDSVISSVIQNMVVKGSKYIEQIEFSDRNNDRTTINFSEIKEYAPKISCSE
ncbi:MAG: outer membrane lipoprotein carrier protein LolA [Deferribacteraceae bacterium]|jgi:outer membrane lipoprotein-sorting protein|nr:outer membrane lipoprotein carrier protein LolA [Deferribacteraceae bacterium]